MKLPGLTKYDVLERSNPPLSAPNLLIIPGPVYLVHVVGFSLPYL